MKKKLIGLTIMAMTMAVGAQCFAGTFTDVDESAVYYKAIENLSGYGVVNGYYDNTFNPNGSLTRAEMAKIIVTVLGYDDGLATYNKATGFSDVASDHWANPYINICNSLGLIKGYADGSFGPNKELSYAEAITIVLRALNYTTDVLGANWPDAYIDKAYSLELLDNIVITNSNLPITRAEMCMLIDKALTADMYGSNDQLIQKMKYTVTKECVITEVDSSNEIKTSIGNYKKSNFDLSGLVGDKVKLILDEDGYVVGAQKTEQTMTKVIVDSAIESGINNMSIPKSTETYYNNTKTTYEFAWGSISQGDTVKMYYSKNGNIDYIFVDDETLIGPYVVRKLVAQNDTKIGDIDISKKDLKIIRDGESAEKSDIRLYDVVYYNESANILTVYSDKITGVYESASPSKTSVKTVVISGTIYDIETQTAVSKLNESVGAYKFDDKVTAVLGKDGKIVDIIDSSASYIDDYGIIINTSSKVEQDGDEKGREKYYVTLLNMSEQTVKYESIRDFSSYKGKLVKYDFEDGLLTINPVSPSKISGTIDKVNDKIGSSWTTKDTKIIELLSNSTGYDAEVRFIDLDDILEDTLDEDYVKNVVIGGPFDDIQLLYLDNVTRSNYQYGILLSSKTGDYTPVSQYKVLVNGKEVNYTSNTDFNVNVNSLVSMCIENGTITKMEELEKYDGTTKVEAVDENRIKLNKGIYRLASDVVVYKKTGYNKYDLISIYDLQDSEINGVVAYGENDNGRQSRVRIIVAN